MSSGSLDFIVRFSRLVAAAADPDEILDLLAQAAVERLGASGAAMLKIIGDGTMRLMACAGSLRLDQFSADADELGPELGDRLMGAAGRYFEATRTMPLISEGDLFGALVLFFDRAGHMNEDEAALANAMVDFAAIALGKAQAFLKLRQAHAELEAARETLARTEKLRALGEMAAGVSHDLKNILTPLGLQVGLLKLAPDHPDRVLRAAEILDRVHKRGVDTVERLRGFSRQSPEEGKTENADLGLLAHEAVELCRHRVRDSRVELRIERRNSPRVTLPTSEFVAAVVNLIVNALDALPEEGGRITVRTGESSHEGWIQVQDTGKGIPEELHRRIFEPFFTTKGKQGTGLGLSMVYAFVQRHGGKINVESAPSRGTTITMVFPPAPTEPSLDAPAGAVQIPLQNGL